MLNKITIAALNHIDSKRRHDKFKATDSPFLIISFPIDEMFFLKLYFVIEKILQKLRNLSHQLLVSIPSMIYTTLIYYNVKEEYLACITRIGIGEA